MQARALRKLSVEEYVDLDRASSERWEYVHGEAFAMAGGSPEHAMVTKNLAVALTQALRGKPCHALHESQKIATPRTRSYHYPDASVLCGPPHLDERDEHAYVNPTVLFEVVSPSTADYDRGGKFQHYRSLPSLREYVVIDHARRTVEHHRKVSTDLSAPEEWLMTELRAGAVALPALDITLAMDDLWLELDWVATKTRAAPD